MIAIITGDIINSKKSEPNIWLNDLKQVLTRYGHEPTQWEIYRGDSFQLEVSIENALKAAILIKASIKQHKEIDVRIAIGIGEKEYVGEKITESNGSAFIRSGECFDYLKKQRLAIRSPWKSFDENMNLLFDIAALTMNGWFPATAVIIKTALENPEMKQIKLAEQLNIKQNTLSEGLKRAGYDEIYQLIQYYQKRIMEQ